MDDATLKELSEIYDLIWNSNYNLATKRVEPLLKKHPAFQLLHCELSVSFAMLSEAKEDYILANSRVIALKKDCSALWQMRKPSLKAYLAELSGEASQDPNNIDYENIPVIDCTGKLTTESGINLKHVAGALWARTISAEINLMESGIKFRQEKYMKGMIDFRKSWSLYKECNATLEKLLSYTKSLQEIPQLLHVRCILDFGVGVFNFMCSVVPRNFHFIIEGLGFKADRSVAMKLLKRSMNYEANFRSSVAAIGLAWIYAFFYSDYPVADQILGVELQRFPSSALILFTNGYVLRKKGMVVKATEEFLKAKESISEIPDFQLKLDYELGANYFLLHQWDQALPLLDSYVSNTKSNAFKCYCYYQLAFCHILKGDDEAAKLAMQQIGPNVRKNYALDEYSSHQAKKYLKKGSFDEFEILYQKGIASHEAFNHEICLGIVEEAKPLAITSGQKGRINQLSGSALSHLRRYEEATEVFMEVLKDEKGLLKSGYDMYALPFALVGLTEISIIQKNLEQAMKYHKKAKALSGYDFETNLVWRIRKSGDDIQLLQKQ